IMAASLNLRENVLGSDSALRARHFIANADREGWMMAGSYFFDLVNLNGNAAEGKNLSDTNSGLESNFDVAALTSPFSGNRRCTGAYVPLCSWFRGDPEKIGEIVSLINGNGIVQT